MRKNANPELIGDEHPEFSGKGVWLMTIQQVLSFGLHFQRSARQQCTTKTI
jgi:hypothetical protein